MEPGWTPVTDSLPSVGQVAAFFEEIHGCAWEEHGQSREDFALEVRTWQDGKRGHPQWHYYGDGERERFRNFLERYLGDPAKQKGNGIFYSVQLRRAGLTEAGHNLDVLFATWIAVDVDGKDFAKGDAGKALAWQQILDFPVQPSFVLDSGHGYQAGWLLDEPWFFDDPEDYREVVYGVSVELNGDAGATDVARVFRVPGTHNLKVRSEPRPVVFKIWAPERRYSLEEFTAYRKELPFGKADTASKIEFHDAALPALGSLRISKRYRQVIESGEAPPGAVRADGTTDRSRRDYRVVCSLISAGCTNGQIREIFRHYPIGDRYHEGGQGDRYLGLTISRARAFIEQDVGDRGKPSAASKPATSAVAVPTPQILPTKTIGEIEDHGPPPNEVLIDDRVLRRKETLLVYGPTASGKSHLVANLAEALACGKRFLDHDVPKARRVLLFSAEGGESLLRERIMQMGTSPEFRGNVFVNTFDDMEGTRPPQIFEEIDIQSIALTAKSVGADVIILDPLYLLNLDGSERDEARMAQISLNCLRLAALADCAVVLVHHVRKGPQNRRDYDAGSIDEVRGSGALSAGFYNAIGIAKNEKDGEETFALTYGKRRTGRGLHSLLLALEDDLRFRVLGEISKEKKKDGPTLKTLREWLEANPGEHTKKDVAQGLACSPRTLERLKGEADDARVEWLNWVQPKPGGKVFISCRTPLLPGVRHVAG